MPPNARALTRAEISLAAWHLGWRRTMFGAALGLMALSWWALHWLLVLVGVPDPFAAVGAIVIEIGMAGTATTATTIRKPERGGYYVSLWVIFSFLMLLAQGANVGHAVIAVSQRLDEFPPDMPPMVVYVFAGAFAALFPLGGTLFIHVSGFLRVHGADAQWVDPDARTVGTRTDSARTGRAPRTRTDTAQGGPDQPVPVGPPVPDVRTEDDAHEPVALSDDERALPPRERARLIYDRMTEGGTPPTGAAVARAFAAAGGEGAVHSATVRRWVVQFAAEPAPASNGHAEVTEEQLERMLNDA